MLNGSTVVDLHYVECGIHLKD